MERSISEQFRFEKLLTTIFTTFINVQPDDIDEKIDQALESIGSFLGTDRCSLFQYNEQSGHYVNTHGWAREGISNLPTGIKDIEAPWITSQLLSFKTVHLRREADLPEEADIDRALARRHSVKAMLMFPLVDENAVFGGLMLDQCENERTWQHDLILRLKIVADVLSSLLIKRRADERLKQAFIEIKQLKDHIECERNYLKEEIQQVHNVENIIGKSPALKRVIRQVEQVGPTDTTVLILGETGVGKELFARAIHKKSLRKDAPLIKVSCASLLPMLIESELFGHEKGAFTGAHSRRKGRFEMADKATIFLDEVGELPLETQGKLLTVLEYGEFERLGSSQTLKVDVRIIAATNRDLEKEVKAGNLRKDLFYRLNVFSITIPPLRERTEDVPILANWMLDNFCKQLGKKIKGIPRKTMELLEAYPWPGNVRELQNIIERSVIKTREGRLLLADELTADIPDLLLAPNEFPRTLPEIEREYIASVLKMTKWKIEGEDGAALMLGLPPSTLRSRIKKHRIVRPW